MTITVRRFEKNDIPKKVEWINDPRNNLFLHYDIPISIEKTERWFESHIVDTTRFDGIIEYNNMPVGTIGLLDIDQKNKCAEYYIAMGDVDYKGKGIAKEASRQIIQYGFEHFGLNRIYLFTESENIAAIRLFEKVGFIREGLLRQDIVSHGKYVDRFVYSILRKDWK